MPAAVTPGRAGVELVAAERADDLRAHIVELALNGVDVLVDAAFLLHVRFELRVPAITLDGGFELSLLFEHEGLVVNDRCIVRPKRLGLLEQPERLGQLAATVEE